MTRRDDAFLQKLRAAFLAEAREHLQAIASSLEAMERGATGARGRALEAAFRHTHSLKGAARAAAYARIEAVCQVIETLFAQRKRNGRPLAAGDFDALHRAFDLVGRWVEAGSDAGGDAEGAIAGLQGSVEGPVEATPTAPATTAPPSRVPAQPQPHNPPTPPAVVGEGPVAAAADDTPVAATDTIRLPMAQVDALLRAAEELLTVRQAADARRDDLLRLEEQLEAWNARWRAVQPALRRLRTGRDAAGGVAGDAPQRVLEFLEWMFGHAKAVEGRVRAASRAAARDQRDTDRQVDELVEQAKALLMVPFSTLAEQLPRLVRELARDQGKQVELRLAGGGVCVDKRVLEQLKDPLLHLVRNAVDHGIETPARRAAAGKPAIATLRVEARLVPGNKVEVVVADDGAGLDPRRLRKAAADAGVVSADAAGALDDAGAIDLAFRSDVSTSPLITEISGRGLGLAIARENVDRLGGTIVARNAAPGAEFTITLPQRLATFRGVFVHAGGQDFVLPTVHVERVLRFRAADLKMASGRQTLAVDGTAVAVARLDAMLGLPRASTGPAGHASAVLVAAGGERMALAVDDVLGDDEVLARPLQRPLVRVRNIAGATVLASGRIVPILHVADLMKTARRGADAGVHDAPPPAPAEVRCRVLVAEDSITSRLLLKGILEAAGHDVRTAADGIEAFTALRSEPFDVLVSDVEMPRLNGFDLTARVRADRTLADLPVILVSALSRREDRERGIDVGANAYITKGGFDQGDLVAAVRRLAGMRERA
jgi:two-component system chemotaxis sensor kinase CheA